MTERRVSVSAGRTDRALRSALRYFGKKNAVRGFVDRRHARPGRASAGAPAAADSGVRVRVPRHRALPRHRRAGGWPRRWPGTRYRHDLGWKLVREWAQWKAARDTDRDSDSDSESDRDSDSEPSRRSPALGGTPLTACWKTLIGHGAVPATGHPPVSGMLISASGPSIGNPVTDIVTIDKHPVTDIVTMETPIVQI